MSRSPAARVQRAPQRPEAREEGRLEVKRGPKAKAKPGGRVRLSHDGMGIVFDGVGKARLFSNDGAVDGELIERVVESVNALSGYTVEAIRKGAFLQKRTQVAAASHQSVVIQGDGNAVT